jgi:hypothetical protein
MAMRKQDPKMKRAFDDFNKVSRIKIPDQETFQKLISLSKKVRAWYSDWSFSNAAFSQMPQSFRDHGVTPTQWDDLIMVLPQINLIRKTASLEIEKEAKAFSAFVKSREESVNSKLQLLESPMIKILKVNITCLSLENQLLILSADEEDRQVLEDKLLEKIRSTLLVDLANGEFKDPFVIGDFTDLLI